MSQKGEPRERSWTENEISFLRENYIQIPIAEIAVQLGRSYEGVRRKAAKVGVQRQDWGQKFTPEEDGILRERYATSPMSEMTELLGRHHNSIRQRAHVLDLVNEEQVKLKRIASGIRHDYFRNVDTPIKAYLLGLLATDGCVHRTSNTISFKIGAKDIELAELMRNEISPHSGIGEYAYPPLPGYKKERKVACFAVASPQLKTDLIGLGIVPAKTFILQWPNLKPWLTASFVLGCFDGDGHLRCGGQFGEWRWDLYSASGPFLDAAHGAIHRHTGLNLREATSRRGLHSLRLNGGKAIQDLDTWLHADVPGLSRKRLAPDAYTRAERETADRRMETGRRRTLAHYPLEKLEQAVRLRVKGLTLDEITAVTGISRSTVYRWTGRHSAWTRDGVTPSQ